MTERKATLKERRTIHQGRIFRLDVDRVELPTGHTVVDINKDYVLLEYGKLKEMVGFPSAGLVNTEEHNAPAAEASEANPENQALNAPIIAKTATPRRVGRRPRLSAASLAR